MSGNYWVLLVETSLCAVSRLFVCIVWICKAMSNPHACPVDYLYFMHRHKKLFAGANGSIENAAVTVSGHCRKQPWYWQRSFLYLVSEWRSCRRWLSPLAWLHLGTGSRWKNYKTHTVLETPSFYPSSTLNIHGRWRTTVRAVKKQITERAHFCISSAAS